MIETHERRLALTRSILAEVATDLVSVDDILGDEQRPIVATARRAVIVLMWRHGMSIDQIALLIGRHRNTIIHALTAERLENEHAERLARGPGEDDQS